jgi:hypothetical protein
MTEVWKIIDGFDEYEVSNLGKVRSVDRISIQVRNGKECEVHFKGKIRKTSNRNGYKILPLWKNNCQTGHKIHKLVVEAFIRPLEPDEEINHIDFDKQNNAVENLEIVSRAGNMYHATIGGRMAHKLTEQDVREIRFSTMWGSDKYYLADKFGVDRVTINHVNWGHNWKRVDLSAWMASHD